MSNPVDVVREFCALSSISFEARLPRTDAGKLYKQGLLDKYTAKAC